LLSGNIIASTQARKRACVRSQKNERIDLTDARRLNDFWQRGLTRPPDRPSTLAAMHNSIDILRTPTGV
jgi:hypothetical protein